MAIRWRCTQCGHTLSIAAAEPRKRLACPGCRTAVSVPARLAKRRPPTATFGWGHMLVGSAVVTLVIGSVILTVWLLLPGGQPAPAGGHDRTGVRPLADSHAEARQ